MHVKQTKTFYKIVLQLLCILFYTIYSKYMQNVLKHSSTIARSLKSENDKNKICLK